MLVLADTLGDAAAAGESNFSNISRLVFNTDFADLTGDLFFSFVAASRTGVQVAGLLDGEYDFDWICSEKICCLSDASASFSSASTTCIARATYVVAIL